MNKKIGAIKNANDSMQERFTLELLRLSGFLHRLTKTRLYKAVADQRGDVPGWVLVVLMTTGLVTAIWTIAAPRLTAILKNSLDAMNGIR